MNGAAIKAGVIGDPISHSLSPKIHGYWLKKYNINGSYEAVRIPAQELESTLPLLKLRFSGFNVTLPHKEAIMQFCDRIDPVASAIGAVNTITIDDGMMVGSNSDAFGFIENLRAQYPSFNPAISVLVLGAGGAARAAVYALIEAGVETVIVCNRNPARAENLAQNPAYKGRVTPRPWAEREKFVAGVGLIVNTTSLGMVGQEKLVLDVSAARAGTCVYDIVYRPLMTDLLLQAKSCGLPVVTGLGMLLHQARPGFTAWFGADPCVDAPLITVLERAAL